MERNINNRDFEQFLKRNTDQYRMHPSENVWKEINSALHTRRRWYGIVASLLFITGAVVTWVMVMNPSADDKTAFAQTQSTQANVTIPSQPVAKKKIPVLQNINPATSIASNRIPSIITEPVAEQDETIASVNPENNQTVTPVTENNISTTIIQSPVINTTQQEKISGNYLPIAVMNENGKNPAESADKTNEKNITPKAPAFSATFQTIPAVSYAGKSKEKKKLSYSFYFTPGVSYRRLTENKEAILAASGGVTTPTNLALRDVKDVVTHKPDMGFELGFTTRYPLSKNINLKAGLQFNVIKYDIRAFSYSGEQATLAIQGSGLNQQAVTSTSYYRNFSGYKPNWLTNMYFSLSFPVGAEVTLVNTKNANIGFGLSAQPTYMLDNRAYMISTDFKNYAKVPGLMRPWNMNAAAEIFVGFNSGKTRWQVGPQVRYQTLSSFKDKYPVKENLFNYGIKAGIILNH